MKYPHFSLSPPTLGLIAHRGISALAPENTLASFQQAVEQKIDWIEFDVRLTKDHELIIFHDDTLERTTNGSGLVHEHTIQQLANLDAGSWFNPIYHEQRIPVFSQILPTLLNLDLHLNIELKIPPKAPLTHGSVLINRLLEVLKDTWPKSRPLPLVSSFHWELLTELRSFLPEIPIGFLQDDCTISFIEKVQQSHNAALHCDYQSLTPALLALAKQAQIPVLAFTVNKPSDAMPLFNAEIFGIFSDNPRQLLAVPFR